MSPRAPSNGVLPVSYLFPSINGCKIPTCQTPSLIKKMTSSKRALLDHQRPSTIEAEKLQHLSKYSSEKSTCKNKALFEYSRHMKFPKGTAVKK
jgi:hypothetical protein